MIELNQLRKAYGSKVALKGLDLKVPAGEVFAFLGPNGAGKTTTIKIMAGLVRPTSGTARIAGYDVVHEPLKAKALLSYVPDEPYLYDKLTAREFMRLVADLYALPTQVAAERIAELSAIFEIDGFADELCETFSHGMKQRVVLASALLHQPKLLVIDEPLVGLDPKSARTLKDLLRRLAREQQVTVFMSTHTLSAAEEVADRIGILANGELVALGTLAELRALKAETIGANRSLEDLFLDLTGANGMKAEG